VYTLSHCKTLVPAEFDDQEEVIQGACWSLDGSHIVTSSKDLLVRLFDPRANSSAALQVG